MYGSTAGVRGHAGLAGVFEQRGLAVEGLLCLGRVQALGGPVGAQLPLSEQLAQQAVTQQQTEAAASLAAELRESGDVTIHL